MAQNAVPVALFTIILAGLCGRCTFQLFHFSSQCPDILNRLSPVVSIVLCQYLHAFLSPKATKEGRKEIEGEKVNSFYTGQSCISMCLTSLHPARPPIPLIPRSSRLLEGRMIEECYPGLLSCQRRSTSLHSEKNQP